MKTFKILICLLLSVLMMGIFAACGDKGGNEDNSQGGGNSGIFDDSQGGGSSGDTNEPEDEEFTVNVTFGSKEYSVNYTSPVLTYRVLDYDNIDFFEDNVLVKKDGAYVGPFYEITESCDLTVYGMENWDNLPKVTVTFTFEENGNTANKVAFASKASDAQEMEVLENSTLDFIFAHRTSMSFYISYNDSMDIFVNGQIANGSTVIKQGDNIVAREKATKYTLKISVDGSEETLDIGFGEKGFNLQTLPFVFGYRSFADFLQDYDITLNGISFTGETLYLKNNAVMVVTAKESGGDVVVPIEPAQFTCKNCQTEYSIDYKCECGYCYDCCVCDDGGEINVQINVMTIEGKTISFRGSYDEEVRFKSVLSELAPDYVTEEYKYFWMIEYEVIDFDYSITESVEINYVPSGFGVNVTYYANAYMTEDGPASDEYGNVTPVPEMYLKSYIKFLNYDFDVLSKEGYWMAGGQVITNPETFVITMEYSEIYYLYGEIEGEENNNFVVSFFYDGFSHDYTFAEAITVKEAANAYGIDLSNYDLFINGEQISEDYILSKNCTIYLKEKTDGCKHEKIEAFDRVCDTTNYNHNLCLECKVVFARIYDAVGNYNDVICDICTEYVNKGSEDEKTVIISMIVEGKHAADFEAPVGTTYRELVEMNDGDWENFSKDSISVVNGKVIDGDYVFTVDTEVYVTPVYDNDDEDFNGEEVTEEVWAKAKDMLKGEYQAQYVIDAGGMKQITNICFDKNIFGVYNEIESLKIKMLMVYTYEDGAYYMYYPDSEGLWAREETDEDEINEINKTFAVFSSFNFGDFTFEEETGRYYAEKIDAPETPFDYLMNVSVYFVDGVLAGLIYSADMGGEIGKFSSVYTYEDIDIEKPVLGEDSGFDVGDNGGNSGGGSAEPTVYCYACGNEYPQDYFCYNCGACKNCCMCGDVEYPTVCPHDNRTDAYAKCGSDLQHFVCDDCGVMLQVVICEDGKEGFSVCDECNYGSGDMEKVYICKKCGNEYKETDICKECGLCYSCCAENGGEEIYIYTVYFIIDGKTLACEFEKEISIGQAAVRCGIDWQEFNMYLDGEQVYDYYVLTSSVRIKLEKKSDVEDTNYISITLCPEGEEPASFSVNVGITYKEFIEKYSGMYYDFFASMFTSFVDGNEIDGNFVFEASTEIYVTLREVEIVEGAMSEEEWIKALSFTNYSFTSTLVYDDGSKESASMYVTENAIKTENADETEYYIFVDGQWIYLYQDGNEGPYYGNVCNNFGGVDEIFIDVTMFADLYFIFKYDQEANIYISQMEDMPISLYFENGVLVEHYVNMGEGIVATVIFDIDGTTVDDIPDYTIRTDGSDIEYPEIEMTYGCKYCGVVTTAENYCFDCKYCLDCCFGHGAEGDTVIYEFTLVCNGEKAVYYVESGTYLKEFIFSQEGFGEEFYKTYKFTVHEKEIDGGYLIQHGDTIVATAI